MIHSLFSRIKHENEEKGRELYSHCQCSTPWYRHERVLISELRDIYDSPINQHSSNQSEALLLRRIILERKSPNRILLPRFEPAVLDSGSFPRRPAWCDEWNLLIDCWHWSALQLIRAEFSSSLPNLHQQVEEFSPSWLLRMRGLLSALIKEIILFFLSKQRRFWFWTD